MNLEALAKAVNKSCESVNLVQARIAVDVTFNEISKALISGKQVELRNFGVFKPKQLKPRIARNPKTGHTFLHPGHKKVNFKSGKRLHERVNKQE